jgi:hypothetical protein
MTLGKDIADKIKAKNERVEWNKVLEEIDWEVVINYYGPNVEDMLNYLRSAYPGWYFENMTVKGLALMLYDRGFFITEETKYFVSIRDKSN